ncbi:MAG: hypothetical protein R3F11_17560 [Verrucomicrobiales bacterium]
MNYQKDTRTISPCLITLIGALLAGVPLGDAAPGELDLGFGGGTGVVVTDFSGGNDTGLAIAVQPDGKILMVGDTTSGSGDFAIARYLPDGDPDTAFGAGGTGRRVVDIGLFDAAVAVQPLVGGKILVGGAGLVQPRGDRDFVVARLLADGTLDAAFGVDGLAITDVDNEGFNETVNAMAVQPDGKIILGGDAADGFTLVRYHASGAVDTGFGESGVVRTLIGSKGSGVVHSLSLQADGRILASGDTLIGNVQTFAVTRYLADGSLDPTFGTGGILTAEFAARARSVVAQPDGAIFLAGSTSGNFFVFRLLPNGAPDPAFGTGGASVVDFLGLDTCTSVLVDPGGKIILSGTSLRSNRNSIAVARLTPAGALDPTFANVGALVTPVGSTDAVGNAAALQSDGKLLIAGTYGVGVVRDLLALRYDGDPAPPRDIEGWRQFYFGSPLNAGDGADFFDFDRDGIINFLEFAFRLNPTKNSAGQLPAAFREGTALTIAFPDPGVDGVRYGAQWSQTMGAASGEWTDLDPESDRAIHVFSAPADSALELFLRLTATPVAAP